MDDSESLELLSLELTLVIFTGILITVSFIINLM